MADIPFEVMMRGPGAVAAWLADAEADSLRKGKRLAQMQIDVLKACGIDEDHLGKLTAETLAIALGACVQTAVLIAYVAKDGMRGPARDALSEIVDTCFDVTEDVEEKVPALHDLIAKLRARK